MLVRTPSYPSFWMADPVFIKPFMFNMASEPISTAYYITPSHQYVSACVLLCNGSEIRYRCNKYTRNNRRIVGRVVFCAVYVIKGNAISSSQNCLLICILYRNFLLLLTICDFFVFRECVFTSVYISRSTPDPLFRITSLLCQSLFIL
jgi:hypothetical protein